MQALPVLGPEGWVLSAQKKLDYAMAHAYASDTSQTSLFPGMVSSFSKVVKECQGDLLRARGEIEEMLETYLKRYFNKVDISVYIYETDDVHRGELVLTGDVVDEHGEKATIHEIMTNKGSVARTFLNYQNQEA